MSNSISIRHYADLHGDMVRKGERQANGLTLTESIVLDRLETTVDDAIEKKIHIITFAGDLGANARIGENYRIRLYKIIKKALDAGVHVVIISGNHDSFMSPHLLHSFASLETIDTTGRLIISDKQAKTMSLKTVEIDGKKLDFLLIPFIWNSSDKPCEEFNQDVAVQIETLIAQAQNPIIGVYHGNVVGAVEKTGFGFRYKLPTNLEFSVSKEVFADEKVVTVLAGHIHTHQKIGKIEMVGSFTELDAGDEGQKYGYNDVEISFGDKVSAKTTFVPVEVLNFKTLKFVYPNNSDVHFGAMVTDAITAQAKELEGKLVRVVVEGGKAQLAQISRASIQQAVEEVKAMAFIGLKKQSIKEGESAFKVKKEQIAKYSPHDILRAKMQGTGMEADAITQVLSKFQIVEQEYTATTQLQEEVGV